MASATEIGGGPRSRLIDTELDGLFALSLTRSEMWDYMQERKTAGSIEDEAERSLTLDWIEFKHILRDGDGKPFDEAESVRAVGEMDADLVQRMKNAALEAMSPDPKPHSKTRRHS